MHNEFLTTEIFYLKMLIIFLVCIVALIIVFLAAWCLMQNQGNIEFQLTPTPQVVVGFQNTITILNFSELKNVRVKSRNTEIATVSLSDTGVVTVTGVSVGAVILVFSGLNAFKLELPISIRDKLQIETSLDTIITTVGKNNSQCQILNFNDLENPTIVSEDLTVAEIKLITDGFISVDAKSIGNTIASISADNAFTRILIIHCLVDLEDFRVIVSSNEMEITLDEIELSTDKLEILIPKKIQLSEDEMEITIPKVELSPDNLEITLI